MSTIEDGISKALSYLNIQREGRILLKKEQETATKELLSGNDVLAVLPTGFGKSLIYTIFALAREEIMSTNTCAIIVSHYRRPNSRDGVVKLQVYTATWINDRNFYLRALIWQQIVHVQIKFN